LINSAEGKLNAPGEMIDIKLLLEPISTTVAEGKLNAPKWSALI